MTTPKYNSNDAHVACPSCQAEAIVRGKLPDAYSFAGQQIAPPLAGGHLYQCNACSLNFRWPRRSKEEHDDLHAAGSDSYWQYDAKRRVDWQLAKEFCLGLNTNGGTSKKSVLDVGCFDGQFLQFLGDGFDRFGIEVHTGAAERARKAGIEIIAADFAELRTVDTTFDITVAMDVIEHTHDPREFLSLMANATSPGGYLLISTGDTSALSWNFMGSRYWYAAIAEHLSFINPDWCQHSAIDLGMELAQLKRFSHMRLPSTLKQASCFARQAAANAFFKFLPGIWGRLRPATGCYGPRSLEERCQSPPPWGSATDHLFAVFRKQNA